MSSAPEPHRDCAWSKSTGITDPHAHRRTVRNEKIMGNVLEAIGNTPMVRLDKIKERYGLKCELVAKCEYFNAGGSVKDRIGYRMVYDAQLSGRIKPGDVLIEPTSGNTGIGIALAGAILGYRVIITLPEKMSNEKVNVLKALGAEIIRTPTEAAWDSPESHIGVALKLNKEIPNSHILDQYGNPSNPLAHYDDTAEEILFQTDGKIDMLVATAGTGGTISGIARKIKEKVPTCVVVGVDPFGSILAEPKELNGDANAFGPYQVEGIGYDFIPKVLDRAVVDRWIKTNDKDSFLMARDLIRYEGLLCGGSSGAAMWGAIQVAKNLGPDARVVVLIPDSIRNYMTKFLDPAWMVDNGYLPPEQVYGTAQEWWSNKLVGDLKLAAPITVSPDLSIGDCADLLKAQSFDQVPVVDEQQQVLGVVTEGLITSKLLAGRNTPADPVSKILFKKYKQVSANTSLAELSYYFNREYFAIVVNVQKNFTSKGEIQRNVIQGIVTRIDLLNFINHGNKN